MYMCVSVSIFCVCTYECVSVCVSMYVYVLGCEYK